MYFKENVLVSLSHPIPFLHFISFACQVMSLVDENSTSASTSSSASTAIPSPQMKELNHSSFSQHNWNEFYSQTLSLLDRLFHDCRLVHGDLSEYNLLLHSPSLTVYVIDFGQSVDVSHPHHLEFLQRDIETINQFYQRRGVHILAEDRVTQMILSGDRSLTSTSK